MTGTKSEPDKIKEAARNLDCDDDPERLKRRTLVKHKPVGNVGVKVHDWSGLFYAVFMLILVALTYPDRNDPTRWWGHRYAWIVALAASALGLYRAFRSPSNTQGL